MSKLMFYAVVSENNISQFGAFSLRHAISRLEERYFSEPKEDGKIIEIILPDGKRLSYSGQLFIEDYFRKGKISFPELVKQTEILSPREVISLDKLPTELQIKALHIRKLAGFDSRLPITFQKFNEIHYPMFVGTINTLWTYFIADQEID